MNNNFREPADRPALKFCSLMRAFGPVELEKGSAMHTSTAKRLSRLVLLSLAVLILLTGPASLAQSRPTKPASTKPAPVATPPQQTKMRSMTNAQRRAAAARTAARKLAVGQQNQAVQTPREGVTK